jgi:hypothetical protein
MGYAGSAQSDPPTETQILHGVYVVCNAAQQFYTQAAQQVADSNLRYKFIELSAIHDTAATHLPGKDVNNRQLQDYSSELAAIQFWYLHQRVALHNHSLQPSVLAELGGLLQQQLRELKQLTKAVTSQNAKVTLAHLSAALQMANDQLQPMLKVLPIGWQNIQTKN